MEYIEQLMEVRDALSEVFYQSGFSHLMFKQSELKLFYHSDNYELRCSLFDLIEDWFANLYLLLKRADEFKL